LDLSGCKKNIFFKNVYIPPSDKKHEVIRPLVRGPCAIL
jgi:hypothetical protein